MKEIIYLVGQISIDKIETYEWRKYVREYFKGNASFEIVDPCNNGFNGGILSNAGHDKTRSKVYKMKGASLLVPKDISYVKRSTIGLANLNHYDKIKAMIGTPFELSIYRDNPDKAVIGIFNGDPTKDTLCNHPFVRETIDTWVTDEKEACELIEYFYKDLE